MSAFPKPVPDQRQPPNKAVSATHATFLRFLPAVQTHAAIRFRDLSAAEREEAIAEATAAAFVNVRHAVRNGNGQRLRPSMVAHYAVLHVKDGRHVGGSADSTSDVMSGRAQRRGGFKVVGLPWDSPHAYDCMTDTTLPTWRDRLKEDRRANVADLAAFRLDMSEYLRRQQDRTRRALGMLAAGYRQVEVAEKLGVTPAAVCQRIKKAEREWMNWQGIDTNSAQPEPARGAGPTCLPIELKRSCSSTCRSTCCSTCCRFGGSGHERKTIPT